MDGRVVLRMVANIWLELSDGLILPALLGEKK